MKKIYVLLIAMMTFAVSSFAQNVNVTATAGTLSASYANLKLAFDEVNLGTHQGVITIDIFANGTNPAAPAALSSSGTGAASYTSILIQPVNDGVSIAATPLGGRGVIELNGADNVTINGDNPNTPGVNRNLTIQNLAAATTTYTSVVRIATLATTVLTADNNTIRNCNITGSAVGRNLSTANSTTGSENTTFGIYCGGAAGSAITSVTTNSAPATTTINNFTASNNAIISCGRGIVFNGANAAVAGGITTITDNLVGDQAATLTGAPPYTSPTNTVYTKGIWVQGTTSLAVTGNSIKNIISYVATATNGIELVSAIGATGGAINVNTNTITGVVPNGSTSASGILFTSATVPYNANGNIITNIQTTGSASAAGMNMSSSGTSGLIEKNKISYIYARSTGGYAARGILMSAGNAITVQNNMIWDLNAVNNNSTISTAFAVKGIAVSSGINHKIYHNSIALYGAMLGASTVADNTTCLVISATSQTGIDIRNNIFSNVMTGAAATVHACLQLPSGGTSAMNLTLNNNAYYKGAAANSYYGITQATFNSYSTLATLAAYTATLSTAATNDNASYASTNAAPYISATDLHLYTASAEIPSVEQTGNATVGVTVDIDNDTRPNSGTTNPDMGADEIAVAGCTGTPNAGTITPASANSCVGATYTMTATGLTTGTGISYQWQSGPSGGPYTDISGATSASYTTPALALGTYYYVLRTTCTPSSSSNITNEFALTVNANPTVTVSPTSASLCSPGGTPIPLLASGADTYVWTPAAGLSSTTIANPTANPTATTTYTVTGTTTATGCFASATTTITVNVAPTISSTTATPTTVCSGGSTQLQVNATLPLSSYAFAPGSGAVYETITSPIVLTTVDAGNTDDGSNQISPASFIFPYNGTNYTGFSANTNGWIKMAAVAPGSNIPSSLTSLAQNGIYAFGRDAELNVANGGNLTHGFAAGGKYVFQFTNNSGGAGGATSATAYLNSQVVLWGSTSATPGRIEIIYGSSLGTPGSNGSIGIASASGQYVNAVTGNSTALTNATVYPASGTSYTFTPPILTYSWSPAANLSDATIANPVASPITANTTYTVQVTGNGCTNTGTVTVNLATYTGAPATQPSVATVTPGAINQQVLLIDLPQACIAENLTDLNLTNNSTLASDVATAKVFYNTTNNFATATLFGSVVNPGATFTVSGTQALSSSTRNYLWLAYDVSCTAVVADTIDGGITNFIIGGNTYTSNIANPVGKRDIIASASFTTVANGEWSSAATWACGAIPPTSSTPVTIAHNITVSDGGNIAGNVTINAGSSLTINAGGNLTLDTLGGGNGVLTNNGTLAVTGGVLNQNGSIVSSATSVFNQSGGEINIDGNAGGVAANSVASGTAILQFNQPNTGINLTGGTLTIVDPHAAATATNTMAVNNGTAGTQTSTVNHTTRFGDGISTDAGGNVGGFIVNNWVGTTFLSLGNIIIDGGSGTNRVITNSEALAAVGDFTVNANSTFNTVSGVFVGRNLLVNASGSLINNTTVNGVFMTLVASNTLTGITFGPSTVPQSITNNGLIANALVTPTASVNAFRVNNTSSSGVTLNAPISVSGTFTMTAGKINTTATNLLTLGYNATNAGTLTYTAGWINGPFKRWITAATGARQFPVGNASSLEDANINFTTVPTTAGSLTASWTDGSPGFPNATPLTEGAITNINKTNEVGSWIIDAGDGLDGGVYTGVYRPVNCPFIIDYTRTVLLKRPSAGGDWILDGTHVTTTGSNSAPVLSRTGMVGFSQFAIGGESNVVLPISVNYLQGNKQGSLHNLNWKVTCTSSPTATMILERSGDNRIFTAINNITADAVRCAQPFDYVDASPLVGLNYYRLKIIDANGKVTYSNTIAMANTKTGVTIVGIAPNPVTSGGNAMLSVASAQKGMLRMVVSDVTGRQIAVQSQAIIAGSNQIPMNVAKLAAGTYNITAITDDGKRTSVRFVKQ